MKKSGTLLILLFGLSLIFGLAFRFASKHGEAVYGIHTRAFNPDKDPKAFKSWLKERWLPAVNKKIPGLTFFVGECDRGPEAGKWVLIMRFDNKAARAKYWPEDGKPTEAWNTAWKNANKGLPDIDEYFISEEGAYLGDYLLD